MLRRIAKTSIVQLNAALGRFNNPLFVFGPGRSGTTWISEVAALATKSRYCFEPFHPTVLRAKGVEADTFPQSLNGHLSEELIQHAEHVVSGVLKHSRTARLAHRLLYKGYVIKDINASIVAKDLILRFPTLKPVLVFRHP